MCMYHMYVRTRDFRLDFHHHAIKRNFLVLMNEASHCEIIGTEWEVSVIHYLIRPIVYNNYVLISQSHGYLTYTTWNFEVCCKDKISRTTGKKCSMSIKTLMQRLPNSFSVTNIFNKYISYTSKSNRNPCLSAFMQDNIFSCFAT